MLGFVLADDNLPFTISLAVMLGIALIEGVSTVLGAALSNVVDTVLPDSFSTDIEAGGTAEGIEAPAPNGLTRVLGWLRVGELPLLIVIVTFLTLFGVIGLTLQSATLQFVASLLPGPVAAAITVPAAIAATRVVGGGLARILPRDETEAVSVDTLVGRVATITIGTARTGRPAEARVLDAYGSTHYLLLEPDLPSESFAAGEQILLVRRKGLVFSGIRNPHLVLSDRTTDH